MKVKDFTLKVEVKTQNKFQYLSWKILQIARVHGVATSPHTLMCLDVDW